MKPGKYNKKQLIIILILVAIISTILFWYIFNNNKEKYEITMSLQDKFLITEKLVNTFPDYTYDVEIFDYLDKGKKSILKIRNVENVPKEKISNLYSSDNINCYLYMRYIIYKEKSSDCFKSLDIIKFENLDADEYGYLVPIAKEMALRNWGFAHYVSEFLIKSNDAEAIGMIKRYAEGNFNSKEIAYNRNSGFSTKEMQEYFNSLLAKYNINK
ncbi:MAG: hypothetical protein CVU84_12755 [Firmicutes bacterium HGW-Firmicutes-1]|jgi:uncharacterized protein YxeA|nr:MAG: hypothetical protein CVU84_12755 [Firmicutes bacterium HGW-Firmicutes-1]